MTWPVGQAEIRRLLASQELEQVTPDPDHASRLLADARTHLASANQLRASDPAGAYQIAYSGYRKTAAALLADQGLRATTRGGHVAVFDAVKAQFNGKAGSPAFAHPHAYRRKRHGAEYPDPMGSGITDEDLDELIGVLQQALDDAARIRASGRLDRFA